MHTHPTEAEGHSHGAGEAFPRLAVRDLVGASIAEDRLRQRLQTWVLGAALALLALAFPTERLLGGGPALVQWADRGVWYSVHLPLQGLARALSFVPGLGAERAWFLIAALCWGACYAVFLRMALSLGTSRLVAGASALLVLLSPLAWLVATLPGPAAPALLGSALLFRKLLERPDPALAPTRRHAPLALWFAVSLFDFSLALLLPAVLWRLLAAPGTTRRIRVATLAWAGLGLVGLALAWAGSASLGPAGFHVTALQRELWGTLRGASSLGAPGGLIGLMVLAPMLGVGCLGIVELLRRPRNASESRPPRWILAFVGVPLAVQLLAGSPSLEATTWALLPPIALGLASWMSRLAEDGGKGTIFLLMGGQLVFIFGLRLALDTTDIHTPWKRAAAQTLQPGDVVITRDLQHEYLLRHRFGVPTINLRAPRAMSESARAQWWSAAGDRARELSRSGGRLVLDWKVGDSLGGTRGYVFQKELHELALLAPTIHIDPRGEHRDPPESLPVPDPDEL